MKKVTNSVVCCLTSVMCSTEGDLVRIVLVMYPDHSLGGLVTHT